MQAILQSLADRRSSLTELSKKSDIMAALSVLLTTLSWTGTERELIEAMPHGYDTLDITGIKNFMVNLGFTNETSVQSLRELSNSQLPCLFIPEQESAKVIFLRDDDQLSIYDSEQDASVTVSVSDTKGTVIVFKRMPIESRDLQLQASEDWCGDHIWRYSKFFNIALLMTLMSNILMLATPLFIMTVYDRVIGTRALDTLVYLLFGICIVYILDAGIRRVRSRSLEHVGLRFSYVVGNDVFKKILGIPCLLSERTGVYTHLARIRDIEQMREFLSGPMIVSLMDLPFTIIGIVVIGIIAGYLCLIPIVGIIVYFILGTLLLNPVRIRIHEAARANAERQELLLETINKMKAIRDVGAENIWLGRYAILSLDAVRASYKSSVLSSLVMSIGQMISLLLGITTIGFGVIMAINGDITSGGLIASMILVWRIVSPLQATFVAISRLGQIRASRNQVNRLMQQELERRANWIDSKSIQHLRGAITFSHISIRFSVDSHPALLNISFNVAPGELVVVIGENGAGKSTVLKLIAGLYSAQAGSIQIDDYDIRQFDPVLLRQAIGYMPQTTQFFDGSILENMRLSKPDVSIEEIMEVLTTLGALGQLNKLPQGLNTIINSRNLSNFTNSFLVDLSLARAIIKKPSILLLDEPINGLDFESERKFIDNIMQLKAKSTIFIATHRPSHLKLCDKVLYLEAGVVKYFGGPEAFLKSNQKSKS